MIIALAGRRIDEENSKTIRFPLENVPLVKERLKTLFVESKAKGIVCGAACGADLIALDVAGELGLHCRIILSSEPENFRKTSVTDRPGDWGKIFDEIYRTLKDSGNVVLLKSNAHNDDIYIEANEKIIDEAVSLNKLINSKLNSDVSQNQVDDAILIVIVWEGSSRGEDDITLNFANTGRSRGFEVVEVLTK